MVCGCLYIYERFTKEDEKVNKYTDIYTDIYTDRNAGNDVAPVTSTENNVPGFCVVVDAGHGGSDGGTGGYYPWIGNHIVVWKCDDY